MKFIEWIKDYAVKDWTWLRSQTTTIKVAFVAAFFTGFLLGLI